MARCGRLETSTRYERAQFIALWDRAVALWDAGDLGAGSAYGDALEWSWRFLGFRIDSPHSVAKGKG